MRSLIVKTGGLLLLASGLLLATPSAAQAESCHRVHQQATGNFGILTGNNINVPLDLDLDVTGNAIALLGLANATRGDTTYTIHCGN